MPASDLVRQATGRLGRFNSWLRTVDRTGDLFFDEFWYWYFRRSGRRYTWSALSLFGTAASSWLDLEPGWSQLSARLLADETSRRSPSSDVEVIS